MRAWAFDRVRSMDGPVSTLKEVLLSTENRPKVINDAVALVDAEVKSKSGVTGTLIKTGYAAVNKFKPTLIPEAVDTLIDRFVEQLEPFYADWEGQGRSGTFEEHLTTRKSEAANALLSVTDQRAEQVGSGVVKSTYQRLRPMGEKNVVAAIPGLGKVIQKYVG